MHRQVALSFLLTLTPTMVSSSLAQPQGEMETLQFITFGEADSVCGEGVNISLNSCDIVLSGNSIEKKFITKEDEPFTEIFSKISDCKYRIILHTGELHQELDLDFSRASKFEYDKYISEMYDKGVKNDVDKGILNGYYSVFGTLDGVKVIKSTGKTTIKENEYSVQVFVKSDGIDGAVNRYESALSYFKANFCSGSAF